MLYVQYSQAVNLDNLLNGLQSYLKVDPAVFYVDFFNINTCGTEGLNNWGLLLNRNRYVQINEYDNIFGFGTPDLETYPLYPQNFGWGNFYGGESTAGRLTNKAYRMLLKLVYARNNCNMSIGAAMTILNTYFYDLGQSNRVVITEDVMTMTFTFSETLEPYQYTVLTQADVLPVPTGVSTIFVNP